MCAPRPCECCGELFKPRKNHSKFCMEQRCRRMRERVLKREQRAFAKQYAEITRSRRIARGAAGMKAA
jgi:hypothetical protein